MTTDDTTVPLAPFDGFYHCTGGRPGNRTLFHAGDELKHGPDCGDGSRWLFMAHDNWVRSDCLVVILTIVGGTNAFMVTVNDTFNVGSIINLINRAPDKSPAHDPSVKGLSYEVVAANVQGDLIHYLVEHVGPLMSDQPVYELEFCPNPQFPSNR